MPGVQFERPAQGAGGQVPDANPPIAGDGRHAAAVKDIAHRRDDQVRVPELGERVPVSASQMRTVPSHAAEATVRPSGPMATS